MHLWNIFIFYCIYNQDWLRLVICVCVFDLLQVTCVILIVIGLFTFSSLTGHSRSLLEAGNGGLVPGALDVLEGVDDELPADLDSPQVLALTDHDYTPVAKRQRTNSKGINYYVPPLDDIGPQNGKVDAGGGFPPDDSSGTKLAARIVDAMVEHATNNYSDPGGQHNNKAQAVVVNLGQGKKRLRDDLELE